MAKWVVWAYNGGPREPRDEKRGALFYVEAESRADAGGTVEGLGRASDVKPRQRPTRRPAGRGKKLATAGEAVTVGEPGQGGRGVDPGRDRAGTQADHPAGVVVEGVPPPVVRADPVREILAVPARSGRPRDDRTH